MTGPSEYPGDPVGIGPELRDARLGRGYSLDDCQRATRISRRYLEALEDEDFEALPAPVFARGFLRSYAQYLGLDPTALVRRYPGEPRPAETLADVGVLGQPPRRPRSRWDDDPYADPPSYEGDDLSSIPAIDTRTPSLRLGPWLVALFVVIVVVGGVVAVVTLGDDEAPAAAPLAATPGVAAGPADFEEQDDAVQTAPTIQLDTMPDLTVRTVSDAVVILRRSGLPFVILEVFDGTEPIGAVLDQLPVPGAPLGAGSSVTLVVSRGPFVETPLAGTLEQSDDLQTDEALVPPGAGLGPDSAQADDTTTAAQADDTDPAQP